MLGSHNDIFSRILSCQKTGAGSSAGTDKAGCCSCTSLLMPWLLLMIWLLLWILLWHYCCCFCFSSSCSGYCSGATAAVFAVAAAFLNSMSIYNYAILSFIGHAILSFIGYAILWSYSNIFGVVFVKFTDL